MAIDDILLRTETYSPLVTKGSDLTPSEMDVNFREIYKALINSQEVIYSAQAITSNKVLIELAGNPRFYIIPVSTGDLSLLDIDEQSTTGVGMVLITNMRSSGDITITADADLWLGGESTLVLTSKNSAWFYVKDEKKYLINIGSASGNQLTSNVTYYVNATSGDDGNDGSSGSPFETITHALSLIYKNLGGYTARINLQDSKDYDEYVEIEGFYNGTLEIVGNDPTALLVQNTGAETNVYNISNCKCKVDIEVMTILVTDNNGFAITCYDSHNVNTDYIYLCKNALVATAFGITSLSGSIVKCSNTTDNLGEGSQINYGLYASGGIIIDETSNTAGATTHYYTDGGQILGSGRTYGLNTGDQVIPTDLDDLTDTKFQKNLNSGFISQNVSGAIVLNYDSGTRKITMTGTDVRAVYEGAFVTETDATFVSGWLSPAHSAVDVTYYLTFDGTDIDWRTTLDFSDVLIAIKPEGCPFALRENHGRNMSYDSHKNCHFGIGTLLGSGGTTSNVVEDSFTASERRPYTAITEVLDEDLQTLNPALNTNSYTRLYLSGSETVNYDLTQTEIIEVGANNRPYYYEGASGSYVKTLIPRITKGSPAKRPRYMSVYQIAVPVTADASSQAYRYIFVQGQGYSTTLLAEQNRNPQELSLGTFAEINPEYTIFKQFVIQYDPDEGTGDWNIADVIDIRGTKNAPISISSTGVFPTAEQVSINTDDFAGYLDDTITNVQLLADKVDDIRYQESITSSATPTPTISYKENEYRVTALSEAAAFGEPADIASVADGNTLFIEVTDDGTGRALSFNAIYVFWGCDEPTTTTAGKMTIMAGYYSAKKTKIIITYVFTEE